MGRSPCCDKVGLKKGPWTPEEDQKLLAYIEEHGHGSWRALPAKAGLQRCGKSCRLRWTNYLRPDIKRGKFSIQEEQTIIQLHALLGNRWSAIATHLPRRTDNEIKNYWNTHLKKRLAKMGIDPVTHKPKTETLCSPEGQPKSTTASLSHMAQWESARLEAEARLARESKLRAPSSINLTTSTSGALQFQQQAGTFLVWPKSASGGQGQIIDLESPTSTLSYSVSAESTVPPTIASVGLMDHHHSSAIYCHEAEEQQEEVEWKCFGRMSHMLDNNKDRHRVGALTSFSSADTCTVFGEEEEEGEEQEESWMPESSSMMRSATGFTEMLLLDRSNEQDSSEIGADSDNADGGSCMDEESYQAKCAGSSSNYWNSILDLVNSSSPPPPPPSTSPPPVF